MSVRVLSRVLRDSETQFGRRLILIALADAATDDGVAFLGVDLIARAARLSRSHTIEVIGELQDDGELQIRKGKRGRSRFNVYRLVLPDLADVDYDRLPFDLDRQFDEVGISDPVEPATGSDPPVDGVGSSRSTGSDLARKSEVGLSLGPERGPKDGPGRDLVVRQAIGGKVDRVAVSIPESVLAEAVLRHWNEATGQALRSRDWLAKIVMRIREYPELDEAAHAAIVASALRDPWWKGAPTPSVVYGSGAQFERCVVAWRTGNAGGRRPDSVSAEEIAAHAEALRRQGR